MERTNGFEWIRGFIRLLYLLRYSIILTPASLVILSWVGWAYPQSALGNVFLVDSTWRLVSLSAMCFLAVAISMASGRVTWMNAPDRFADIPESLRISSKFGNRSLFAWLLGWTVIGGLLPAACYHRTTVADGYILDWSGSRFIETSFIHGALAILVGGLCAVAALMVFALMARLIVSRESLPIELTPFDRFVQWIPPIAQANRVSAKMASTIAPFAGRPNGYIRESPHQSGDYLLAPGHERLTVVLILLGVGYGGIYYAPGLNRPEEAPFPVLFYAVLVLLILNMLLNGLAFLFDYYRVPTLAIAILGWMLIGTVYRADHYFELLARDSPSPEAFELESEAPPPKVAEKQPDLNAVLASWRQLQLDAVERDVLAPIPPGPDGKRTLVFVCAAGGGIQASAWTAEVLAGLHERYGPQFTRSVGVVSGVSGGSLGTYFYLLRYPELIRTSSADEALDWIRHSGTVSGLEAVGWGLAFPDLIRGIAPTSWLSPGDFVDRGLALEQVWRRRVEAMPHHDAREHLAPTTTLRDMESAVLAGESPIPIFNTTVADNGQRFLLSPIRLPLDPIFETDADEFLRLYPNSDIHLTTAVRLSATFSYVTPICRPERKGIRLSSRWIADGGYADNDGVVTAVTSLLQMLTGPSAQANELPFDRVVIVRILAFPERGMVRASGPADLEIPSSAQERRAARIGWRKATLGPLQLLMAVRNSSQHERANLELDLVEAMARSWRAQPAEPAGTGVVQANAMMESPFDIAQEMQRKDNMPAPIPPAQRSDRTDPIQIATLKLVFDSRDLEATEDQLQQPPLSWKMSRREIENLHRAWEGLDDHEDSPFQKKLFFSDQQSAEPNLSLDEVFERRP